MDRVRTLIIAKENPSSTTHSARTAVAHLFGLPEADGAAITTVVTRQSALGASLPI